MIELKVTGNNFEELKNQVMALGKAMWDTAPDESVAVPAGLVAVNKKSVSAKKSAITRAANKAAAEKAAEKAVDDAGKIETVVPNDMDGVETECTAKVVDGKIHKHDTKDFIKALGPVNEQLGKAVAAKVLAEFGVARISQLFDLTFDKQTEFIKYCNDTVNSSGQKEEETPEKDIFG